MTILTPELADVLEQSVLSGSTATQAAEANGVNRSTLHEWQSIADSGCYRDGRPASQSHRKCVTALIHRLTRARATRYQTLTNALYLNATTINPKTGHTDTQAADKLLSKSADTREDWQEPKHLVLEGTATTLVEHRLVRQLAEQGVDVLEAHFQELIESNPSLNQP